MKSVSAGEYTDPPAHGPKIPEICGRQDVALENLGETGQGTNAFLDAGAARVVQGDHRSAYQHGLIHDLADLQGKRFRKATAEYGEVLRSDIHHAAIHRTATGYHAVAVVFLFVHAEGGGAVRDEHVEFLEGTFVQQQVDAFAGRQFVFVVLGSDTLFPSAQVSYVPFLDELADFCGDFRHNSMDCVSFFV